MGKREEMIGTLFVRVSEYRPGTCGLILAWLLSVLVDAEPGLFDPLKRVLDQAEKRG
jgi:hypothetical protein